MISTEAGLDCVALGLRAAVGASPPVPDLPPVVEGGHVNPQLLGNLDHALPIGRAHSSSHISLNGLAVSTH